MRFFELYTNQICRLNFGYQHSEAGHSVFECNIQRLVIQCLSVTFCVEVSTFSVKSSPTLRVLAPTFYVELPPDVEENTNIKCLNTNIQRLGTFRGLA